MSDRPYTEQDVFEVEMASDDLAAMLNEHGPRQLREMGVDTLSSVLYDACIALREVMIDEENEARRSNG